MASAGARSGALMRLVFFGSGAFGVPTLKRLVAEHDVAMIVTQPDRPAGRHRHLTPTAIADIASKFKIATLKPENVNDPNVVEEIRSIGAAGLVVIAFGQKLGQPLLKGLFAINLHASLLPKFRGAAPINWAMINGEHETGLSVITLADRMDSGDILGQAVTPIDPHETAGELHDRLAEMGPALVLEVLRRNETGHLPRQRQDERLASRAPKLTKADGSVSFDQPAANVRSRVHGLTPWPGCWIELAGRSLRLARVEVASEIAVDEPPGVMLADRTIACAPGAVRLLAVQSPGGKLMSFDAYCHGHEVSPGERCAPAPVLGGSA
jgi:methionyl-tRNA formyltransferase